MFLSGEAYRKEPKGMTARGRMERQQKERQEKMDLEYAEHSQKKFFMGGQKQAILSIDGRDHHAIYGF